MEKIYIKEKKLNDGVVTYLNLDIVGYWVQYWLYSGNDALVSKGACYIDENLPSTQENALLKLCDLLNIELL